MPWLNPVELERLRAVGRGGARVPRLKERLRTLCIGEGRGRGDECLAVSRDRRLEVAVARGLGGRHLGLHASLLAHLPHVGRRPSIRRDHGEIEFIRRLVNDLLDRHVILRVTEAAAVVWVEVGARDDEVGERRVLAIRLCVQWAQHARWSQLRMALLADPKAWMLKLVPVLLGNRRLGRAFDDWIDDAAYQAVLATRHRVGRLGRALGRRRRRSSGGCRRQRILRLRCRSGCCCLGRCRILWRCCRLGSGRLASRRKKLDLVSVRGQHRASQCTSVSDGHPIHLDLGKHRHAQGHASLLLVVGPEKRCENTVGERLTKQLGR